MLVIKEARADDFETIYPLLREMNGSIGKEDWQALFRNHYGGPEDYFGFAAYDEGRAVGFMGLIFSARTINGRTEKFCNMTTWVVTEACRGKGAGGSLLAAVVGLKDYTITNLTPAVRTVPMLLKFGYQRLEEQSRIIFPVPTPAALAARCSLVADPAAIEAALTGADRKIYKDHKDLKCSHWLIRAGREYCYLITKAAQRKNLPLAEIHYISNFDLFLKTLPRLRLLLCGRLKVLGLLLDKRFLRGRDVRFALTVGTEKYYLSPRVDKQEITDNLYTELLALPI